MLAAITSDINKGDDMASFANPNAFAISRSPNISGAIESGFNMGVNKQNLDMKKQAFANEQSDREEMRNAMAEYGSATDREGQKTAAAKVGVVSPEMYARLEKNWIDADENQRKAMKENMDIRGNVAYMAMKENDPEIWNSYVASLPEELQRAMPEYSPTAMKVTAAQSAEMMDTMNKLETIKAQGEKQKEVAGYQGGVNRELENLRTSNDMKLQDSKFEKEKSADTRKLVNDLTINTVKQQQRGGASGMSKNEFAALKYAADMGDPQAEQMMRELAGIETQPQGSVGYTYIPGKGLVPKQ